MTLNSGTVFLAALITAIATGFGAIPFFFVRTIPRVLLGLSNAVAAGLMLGASYGLVTQGFRYSPLRVVAGAIVGAVFISLTHRLLNSRQELEVGALRGADALKALMIVGIMTVHSFAEGVGVGVSFGGGQALGGLITAAIAVHNIPEGLAISLVIVPRGASPTRAALWSIFSSLPQPLMAVPAFLFVQIFQPFLPAGLGFAAGAMVWMVFRELIPDALQDASRRSVILITVLSVAAMLAFQTYVLTGR